MNLSTPLRLAGRVIAIDPAGRVLLFFYDDPPPKGRHWATPGGGVEGDEDFYHGRLPGAGRGDRLDRCPGRAGRGLPGDRAALVSARQGLVRQTDHYFIGRVPDELRPLGEVAAMHVSDGIDASRWWTVAELEATDETIYPQGLADLVRVGAGGAGVRASRPAPVALEFPDRSVLVPAMPLGRRDARQLVDERAGVDRADAGHQVVALAGLVAGDGVPALAAGCRRGRRRRCCCPR